MKKDNTISKAAELVNNMHERMLKGDSAGVDRVKREILSICKNDETFGIKTLVLTIIKFIEISIDLLSDHLEIEKRKMERVKGFRKNLYT
jgi:hypothetical protein